MKSVPRTVNFFKHKKVDELLQQLSKALFPAHCYYCGRGQSSSLTIQFDICEDCWAELPWLAHACRSCAEPLIEPGFCGRCLHDQELIQHCLVPLRYETPVNTWIQAFKYHGELSYGRCLTEILLRTIQSTEIPLPDIIVPVPMHKSRLRQRGYNQAAVIANDLGKWLNRPVLLNTLQRKINSKSQSTLSKQQRRQNLTAAFSIDMSSFKQGGEIPQQIALVDDVITTGSTIKACASVLKQAGVQQVTVWALARTP